MRHLYRKRLSGLIPADDAARAEFAKLKADADVLVEVVRARNPNQHRLYWSLIDLALQQTDEYATREQLSNVVKVAVGWCDTVTLKNGTVMAIPKSISFANMPQDQFEEFFEKVLRLLAEKIGVTPEVLRGECEAAA